MEIHLLLKKYFDRKKNVDSSFTMRFLAEKIDASPSFLSRLFKGEKKVPYATLIRLAALLEVEPEVLASLKTAYASAKTELQTPSEAKSRVKTSYEGWELTSEESLRVLRQWFYLPILEFVTLKNFDGTKEQISERLGVSPTTAEIALGEMLSLGLIEMNNGRPRKADVKLRWTSAKSRNEIRSFHDQMLGKAQENLRQTRTDEDFQRRLISGITVTANPERIEAAKKKLAECLHEIANDLSAEEGTEVYQLAVQLFPLTKSSRDR